MYSTWQNRAAELGFNPSIVTRHTYTLTYKVNNSVWRTESHYGYDLLTYPTLPIEISGSDELIIDWTRTTAIPLDYDRGQITTYLPNRMPECAMNLDAVTATKRTLRFLSDGQVISSDSTMYVGRTITTPSTPTKLYYTFVEWSNLPNDMKMPDSNLDVTAVWQENPKYTVTYMSDETIFTTQQWHATEPIVIPSTTPTKMWYTFSSWNNLPQDMLMPGSNIVVNAVFTENPKYTITYSYDNVVYGTESYYENQQITAHTSTEPERAHYLFDGWDVPAVMPARNITVSPLWIALHSYTVTYYLDDRTTVYATQTYYQDDQVITPPATNPTKPDFIDSGLHDVFTFAEWDGISNIPTDDWPDNYNVYAVFNLTRYIEFESQSIKNILIARGIDTDNSGQISTTEAAAVRDEIVMYNTESYSGKFNEFKYFTRMTELSGYRNAIWNRVTEITIPRNIVTMRNLIFSHRWEFSPNEFPTGSPYSWASDLLRRITFEGADEPTTLLNNPLVIYEETFWATWSSASRSPNDIYLPRRTYSIGWECFANNYGGLEGKTVSIGEDIQYMGNYVFSYTSGVIIEFRGTTPPTLQQYTFCNKDQTWNTSLIIRVPAGYINTYKNASTYWTQTANNILIGDNIQHPVYYIDTSHDYECLVTQYYMIGDTIVPPAVPEDRDGIHYSYWYMEDGNGNNINLSNTSVICRDAETVIYIFWVSD